MKLDLEPESNRKALENATKFSVGTMLIFKPGFYYFLGGIFILFGLVAIFSADGVFKRQPENLSQNEAGLLSLAVGLLIVGLCKLALWLIKNQKKLANSEKQ